MGHVGEEKWKGYITEESYSLAEQFPKKKEVLGYSV